MSDDVEEQVAAAVRVVDSVTGDAVRAAYLYGSAVTGGLKPASDLDLLVVVTRPTTPDERLRLVRDLAPISNRELRPAGWRPIELTTVVISDGRAQLDFQYGEWLRDEFATGDVEPAARAHVDLPILIGMARDASVSLRGAPAADTLPDVSCDELTTGMTRGIPDLLADIETDTVNVLLTLARIWSTLGTGTFVAKDDAAAAFIERFPQREWRALEWARRVYLGSEPDGEREARGEAEQIVAEIGRWLQSETNVDQISWR
ncbi:MAG: aminoglycoside adenylyltransferase domain-containing protein [Candidatus Limnocylindrales bacterium]